MRNDELLFPINNVFELAEVLENLSDDSLDMLLFTLKKEYGKTLILKDVENGD